MTWEMLHLSIVLLVAATALDKLRSLNWHSCGAVQRANCCTLTAIALALAIVLPPVYLAIDQFTGIPNLAGLLNTHLVVFGLWAFQPVVGQLLTSGIEYRMIEPRLARHMQARRKILGSHWLLIGIIAILTVLFVLAPIHGAEAPGFNGLIARYGEVPFMTEYTLIAAGYLALFTFDLFLLARAGIQSGLTPPLRLRARLQAYGWVAALALLLHECLYVALRRLDMAYSANNSQAIRSGLIAGSITLLMSGSFLDLYGWAYHYHAYRQLFLLWRDLRRATPEIKLRVLFQPSRSSLGDALAMNDIQLRLQRRATEIRDAALALRPYINAAAVERAQHLCLVARFKEEDTRATIEAVALRSAIRTKQSGNTLELLPLPASDDTLDERGTVDELIEREVAHLRRVARAARRSSIVAIALANMERDGVSDRLMQQI
jgi:hypothetical protein